jgi:hypothetical protein
LESLSDALKLDDSRRAVTLSSLFCKGSLDSFAPPRNEAERNAVLPSEDAVVCIRRVLGVPLFSTPYKCTCGNNGTADVFGDHVEHCNHLSTSRHNAIVLQLEREATVAGIATAREQRADHSLSRPGDLKVIGGLGGRRDLLLDVTVSCVASRDHAPLVSLDKPDAAAQQAAELKRFKYRDTIPLSMDFVPFAVQSTGGLGLDALNVLSVLAKRTRFTRKLSSTANFELIRRRISLQVWRSYAACVRRTWASLDNTVTPQDSASLTAPTNAASMGDAGAK